MEKDLKAMEDGLRYHLRKHMTRPVNMRWHNSRNRPFLNNIIGFRASGDGKLEWQDFGSRSLWSPDELESRKKVGGIEGYLTLGR